MVVCWVWFWRSFWLLLCICLLWATQWRAVIFTVYDIAPLLCRLHLHRCLPGLCLEELGFASWNPAVREKVSRRTVGCLANLVAESWSSLLRPRACVRAGDDVITPMIPARGSRTKSCAPLHHVRCPIACIDYDGRKVLQGTHGQTAGLSCLKACEITERGCASKLNTAHIVAAVCGGLLGPLQQRLRIACLAWNVKTCDHQVAKYCIVTRGCESRGYTSCNKRRGYALAWKKKLESSGTACTLAVLGVIERRIGVNVKISAMP